MRRGYQDTDFLTDDNGKIMGINLGWDFCAEHEWGIKGLQRDFGLQIEDKLGFEARRNTIAPYQLMYHEGETIAMVYHDMLDPKKDRRELS